MGLRLSEVVHRELPLVSVITTAYNYERFLPRALDSALAQNYPADRLEILIVDDGSTDSTPEILAGYAARHPRQIRVFRQRNAGFVAATNLAFSEAKGELWALLDADDLWPADKTIRQVELFQRNPRVGAVYADMEIIDADDNVVMPSYWGREGLVPERGAGALARLLVHGNYAAASAIMVRAALREHFAPIPDGVPYPDWWLMTQLATVAEIDYLPDLRMGYRLHGTNMGHGATGMHMMRDRLGHIMSRRQALIRGGAAALPVEALLPTWLAVERDAVAAVNAAGSAFVPFPAPSDESRAASARAAARARVLQARGADTSALRAWVTAAAHDPFDHHAREAITALGANATPSLGAGVDPLGPARSFVALISAEELRLDPSLLARFAAAFDDQDAATLYVHAPRIDAETLGRLLTDAIDASGVSIDRCDVIARPDPECLVDPDALRQAADALLAHVSAEQLRARYDDAVALETPPRARR